MKKILMVAAILAIPSVMLLGFEKLLDHKGAEVPPPPSDSASIEIPARAGSKFPFLDSSPGGDVYLSWLEPAGEGQHRLRLSRLLRNRWTQPLTIAQGPRWFVNWADFPSLKVGSNGLMAAHWLAYRAEGKYDYDVQISLSRDSGSSWTTPITPHRDGIAAEHGFVSMVEWRNRFSLFWLDGRHTVETPPRPMTLRHAFLDGSGQLSGEVELDASVCDCCQTGAAVTIDGPIVAYRDRSEGEIRDIRVIRFDGSLWSEPLPVGSDGWMIEGCPVNGPAIDAHENQVAIAWFTQADDNPQVRLAFSQDAGMTFPTAFRVDQGDPYGRVDVLLNPDGSTWVSWLEARTDDGVDIRLRRFTLEGPQEEVIVVGQTSGARSSGFPRMARYGRELLIAWTEPGDASRIRSDWIR